MTVDKYWTKLSPCRLTDDNLRQMIGESVCIKELSKTLQKYARCDAEVLIQGETGVGKGLCARIIHQLSRRQHCPFIEVNCGAIPSGLIASELFGHEKGAFTGAVSERVGFIQRAHGGTLFLDEIGDMPADLQIHLLHFLRANKSKKSVLTEPQTSTAALLLQAMLTSKLKSSKVSFVKIYSIA